MVKPSAREVGNWVSSWEAERREARCWTCWPWISARGPPPSGQVTWQSQQIPPRVTGPLPAWFPLHGDMITNLENWRGGSYWDMYNENWIAGLLGKTAPHSQLKLNQINSLHIPKSHLFPIQRRRRKKKKEKLLLDHVPPPWNVVKPCLPSALQSETCWLNVVFWLPRQSQEVHMESTMIEGKC